MQAFWPLIFKIYFQSCKIFFVLFMQAPPPLSVKSYSDRDGRSEFGSDHKPPVSEKKVVCKSYFFVNCQAIRFNVMYFGCWLQFLQFLWLFVRWFCPKSWSWSSFLFRLLYSLMLCFVLQVRVCFVCGNRGHAHLMIKIPKVGRSGPSSKKHSINKLEFVFVRRFIFCLMRRQCYVLYLQAHLKDLFFCSLHCIFVVFSSITSTGKCPASLLFEFVPQLYQNLIFGVFFITARCCFYDLWWCFKIWRCFMLKLSIGGGGSGINLGKERWRIWLYFLFINLGKERWQICIIDKINYVWMPNCLSTSQNSSDIDDVSQNSPNCL